MKIKLSNCFLLALVINLLITSNVQAQAPLQVKKGILERNFGKKIFVYADTSKSFGIKEALKEKNFVQATTSVPNLGVSDKSYWLRFPVVNISGNTDVMLQLQLPTIDFVDFYLVNDKSEVVSVEHTGDRLKYSSRKFDNPIYSFKFGMKPSEPYQVFLNIRGGEQLQAPLILGNTETFIPEFKSSFLIFGFYMGVVSVMFIYNLFLYVSTKDKSYLYYIIYIFVISLTQANFQGYAFKFVWPNNLWMSTYAVYILSSLAAMTAIEFMKQFLHTAYYVPKLHRLLNIFYIPYILALVAAFSGYLNTGYQTIQVTAVLAAVYMLIIAFRVYALGYNPAKFFLLAWSVFLIGVCIFVLKDYNILPYNTFTYNMMPFGSALEVTLLSFALADKINTFKKEKEESQAEALRVIVENEKLVREQNVVLEIKVKERTEELELVLTNLKEAQSQLVDSEKMAGLGQLTAGIAHEINNPINFVTSNIKPLELDILDLDTVIKMYEDLDPEADLRPQIEKIESFKKQIDLVFVREEIKSLLSGIGEGARRTAEIIRSLKNFSRLDENDTKPVDLNEGIASTLVLVKNTFPDHLQVVKEFAELPLVECLPGKINQVFMNLITNAVHAIKSKEPKDNEGVLSIKTWQEGDNVKISIKDSGTGMPDEVKQKIFEPFFTTKDVGEGTGLGLSIVFRIIENHNGNIDVITKLNQGTEFIITLPINSK
ncbi:7TM diverse intracellular signaling domain-containing protein [Pedobacter sp. JCM 36344]|uniref:sensor histidine kinase n=1 Tax=Pedobacter sp. JCM 36344 TaxID=3374280 RepID=UPI0039799BEC